MDELRAPFVHLFDPGAKNGLNLKDILNWQKSQSSNEYTCERIDPPTAEEFYNYVKMSKPFIMKEKNPERFKSDLWSFASLKKHLKDTKVSCIKMRKSLF